VSGYVIFTMCDMTIKIEQRNLINHFIPKL